MKLLIHFQTSTVQPLCHTTILLLSIISIYICIHLYIQLNALARISRHLNINSRRAVYNSFIMSNFNNCPLVRHFFGQVNNQKLQQIQERAPRILFADYNSSYLELLKRAGTTTLLIQRLRLIALNVFKSLHGLNPPCLKKISVAENTVLSL